MEVKIAKGDYLGIYEDRKVSLPQFSQEYLVYADANKSSGAAARDRMSLKPLLTAFPDYLSTITPKAIEAYKAARLQRVKPATVNRELALLKYMFMKAIEWGYVKENPAKAVKLLREPPGRVRYLSQDDLSRLLFKLQISVSVFSATGLMRAPDVSAFGSSTGCCARLA